ncbi:hypothetical protein SPHINGOT1_80002 [Sphingomonas sp. T1]|nr:hypothetical protein SPHINGOT1_80002 [Sphingomonas sp. T1]
MTCGEHHWLPVYRLKKYGTEVTLCHKRDYLLHDAASEHYRQRTHESAGSHSQALGTRKRRRGDARGDRRRRRAAYCHPSRGACAGDREEIC